MKTQFISQLSNEIQSAIQSELTQLGLSNEDLDNAMNSRLSDLSDTININKYLYSNQLSHIKEILIDIITMENGKVELEDLIFHAHNYNEEFDYNLSENSINQLVNEIYSNI